MSNTQKHAYKIVILVPLVFLLIPLVSVSQSSIGVPDSQAFLGQNTTPAGPPANKFSGAVEKLLAQMTLKEKIGQMTQLDLAMVTNGRGQDMQIDPQKLHKALGDYGVGSILNVNDRAVTVEKWQEVIRAIQDEAKKTRLQSKRPLLPCLSEPPSREMLLLTEV